MIKRLGYEKPMPIQAQALPIITISRDCIGIAKTGSGKTLVYVLPMLRHSKDHPPVVAGWAYWSCNGTDKGACAADSQCY
ncbi:hypothetical protein DVH24_028345 [Malus domestica]|uniref:DEAD/DEAH-box helicase domain-containing protein n=1 Tax=Malus domestica TaxID=3750 RepID=A0A498H9R9_MALDO|nr:hypothetical protein DVH24_028345 [Malus domestica]